MGWAWVCEVIDLPEYEDKSMTFLAGTPLCFMRTIDRNSKLTFFDSR